ncbi:GNAT family N-acetyltransferase [Bifidobacterium simiarum]|nr:GNAT family N-acetyltransferase [Bifidobacterium simiarum]MBT1165707.1 GNAT family N-acetyltransferase [Bifidobacterium simiarum]
MSQVVLRSMRAEDLPSIEHIVGRTWNYEDQVGVATAVRFARIDTCNCLSRRTFMRVADIDGRIAGFIVANDLREPRRDYALIARQIMTIARLALSREGREGLRMFAGYERADARLRQAAKAAGKRYEGEVVLFIVSPEFKGHGVGRRLFGAAMDYFRQRGIEDFFLFTDTSCDFGFYEHRGLIRRCARNVSFSLNGHDQTLDMYIYDDATSHQLERYGVE